MPASFRPRPSKRRHARVGVHHRRSSPHRWIRWGRRAPVSRPASQPKRGSAITGDVHTSVRSVSLPTGSGSVAARARNVTRVCCRRAGPGARWRLPRECRPRAVRRTSSTMASTAWAAGASANNKSRAAPGFPERGLRHRFMGGDCIVRPEIDLSEQTEVGRASDSVISVTWQQILHLFVMAPPCAPTRLCTPWLAMAHYWLDSTRRNTASVAVSTAASRTPASGCSS